MTATALRATQGAGTGSPGKVAGTAVVYNTPTVIATPYGSFEEMVAPGALKAALSGRHGAGIALLRDHNSSLLLGRRSAGSLELTDTLAGLRMRAELPATALGRETRALVERRDLNGMSFAFTVDDDGDTWHEPAERSGLPVRVIHRIARLYEVTICTFPAYEATTVDLAERGARRLDLQRRHLATHIAMAGGWPHGRRTLPRRELWAWCHRHPVRIGTRPGAAL